jgi:CRISPR-associated protein Cas2
VLCIIGENLPAKLAGWISHWLIEVQPQVYIGVVSARVRDQLLQQVRNQLATGGGATAVYSARTEQGLMIKTYGATTQRVVDLDGVLLMAKRTPLP